MACMAQAVDVRLMIIEDLGDRSLRPTELIANLSKRGMADSEIRRGISELIRDGVLELTSESYLQITEDQAA